MHGYMSIVYGVLELGLCCGLAVAGRSVHMRGERVDPWENSPMSSTSSSTAATSSSSPVFMTHYHTTPNGGDLTRPGLFPAGWPRTTDQLVINSFTRRFLRAPTESGSTVLILGSVPGPAQSSHSPIAHQYCTGAISCASVGVPRFGSSHLATYSK